MDIALIMTTCRGPPAIAWPFDLVGNFLGCYDFSNLLGGETHNAASGTCELQVPLQWIAVTIEEGGKN